MAGCREPDSPDWFPRETQRLLVEYCRLIVDARRVSVLRDKAADRASETGRPADVKAYRDMLRTADGITLAGDDVDEDAPKPKLVATAGQGCVGQTVDAAAALGKRRVDRGRPQEAEAVAG